MRVIAASAFNFASYKNIGINFENKGLTLISGPTGSGKSTLCDLIPWVLFGITSKNGTVNEIRSWNTNKDTKAIVTVKLQDKTIVVGRQRGKSNDLYFVDLKTEEFKRGKDLNDTQKLINNLLGLTPELYLAGAYYHEFSQTAQFFTTTAKNRRIICEQIVDLNLAKKITEKISEESKQQRILQIEAENTLTKIKAKFDVTDRLLDQERTRLDQWDEKHYNYKLGLQINSDNYDSEVSEQLRSIELQMDDLSEQYHPDSTILELQDQIASMKLAETTCPHCGSPANTKQRVALEHQLSVMQRKNIDLEQDLARLDAKIDELHKQANPYIIRLKEAEETMNPHKETCDSLSKDSMRLAKEAIDVACALNLAKTKLQDLELLQECASALRATTITHAISDIEHQTNQLLTDYFDGEIQVSFTVEDADKLDVKITKDGNDCSYTQLSKGQRQMLKLSFAISVMRQASNHSGVSFSEIFLDESLDGLDENLKVKAFRLLESLSLEYSSVFVVEHSQSLKSMFTSGINVQLVNGHSEIYEN